MRKKKKFIPNKLYRNLLIAEKKIAFNPYSPQGSKSIKNILDKLNLKVIKVKNNGLTGKMDKDKFKFFNKSFKNVKKSFSKWKKSKNKKR